MRKCKFITFEGGEGSGKTSCWEYLKSIAPTAWHDKEIVFFNDPAKDHICGDIRNILLSDDNVDLDDTAELFLFLAARAQLTKDIMQYYDNPNAIVICDRYELSTYAYQTRKAFDEQDIDRLHVFMRKFDAYLIPDHTIWFDVEPRVGLRRSSKRLQDNQIDEARFENMNDSIHIHVYNTLMNIYHRCNSMSASNPFTNTRAMTSVDCNIHTLNEVAVEVELIIDAIIRGDL